jgi:hypothetical protein
MGISIVLVSCSSSPDKLIMDVSNNNEIMNDRKQKWQICIWVIFENKR